MDAIVAYFQVLRSVSAVYVGHVPSFEEKTLVYSNEILAELCNMVYAIIEFLYRSKDCVV